MNFENKSILITGGTGTFGKEFVEFFLKNKKFKKLIIFSRDELKQFEMQKKYNDKRLRYLIGDIRDLDRLKLATKDVDILIHAAALKHVPAAEYNPMEVIKTNIYGSNNVISAAIENNIKNVLALSTDKACNPINLYGSTKLASEKLFVAANNIVGKTGIKFSVVRYGNVVGSRGSIIPIFKEKINKGEYTLPITNEEMTRFWITPEEAIEFVLKSLKRMKGGETFIPKSPSIKILDLAKSFSPKVKIKIIGMRPGEKLHEVLCPKELWNKVIEFKDHYVIEPSITFFDRLNNYEKNILGEVGKKVKKDFEYNSANNQNFFEKKQIEKFVKRNV
jgi:UDP-N-acetylglucosamine 4,6-dehydratase/5-epimerase